LLLFPHHVFHPRDLHFLKNSPKRRKYCFSVTLNSLFMCLRSLVESWCSQYVVILNVSDMIIENISARVSGLCGRMKVSQKPLPVQYRIPAHFRNMPDFKPVEFDGFGNLPRLHITCAEHAGATVLITTEDAPEKHYEPPQRYNSHTNHKPCCMV